MVLFVCNYHIWQQGWLGQYVTVFGRALDFDFWTRSSYVFVDGMILLSGFLLYLPYARQKEYGTPVVGVRAFYWKRLSRIVPSYMVSVLIVLFAVALPGGAYRDAAAQNLDIITHLTFTFTFFPNTYLFTPLNGVLWTVAIEMQFYLIFPWLARAVRKAPALTLCLMGAAGILFRVLMARYTGDLSIWLNQLPAFLDVYVLGILGAMAYSKLAKALQEAKAENRLVKALPWLCLAVFAAGCCLLVWLLRLQTENGLVSRPQLMLSQWMVRLPLALTLLGLMLSAAFMPRFMQKLLDNRLMRFLATISFNLYIWHQILSVLIARNLFPDWLHSDYSLQVAYTLLCYGVSILTAMAATYGVEQPAAQYLERVYQRYLKNKETKNHERPQSTDPLPATDTLLVRPEEGGTGAH